MLIPARTALPRTLHVLQVYRGSAATHVDVYHLQWWGGAPPRVALATADHP